MKLFLKSIYIFFYSNNILKQKFLNKIVNLEGGQLYSKTLREHFENKFSITVGLYSYGGIFNSNRIAKGTKVGRYCSIAPTIYIFNRNHPYKRISQHPFFYNSSLKVIKNVNINSSELIIGHDVWIGEHTIITPSVNNIGIGVVIAAGSVVTKDVPNFAIVAGNPARIINYRFEIDKQESVLSSKWWEKSIEEIKNENLNQFLTENFKNNEE
jgi:virginiamycin A acetyltransferase